MGSVFAGAARAQAAQRLTSARHGQLPVSDSNGGYVGIVTARTVAETVVHGGHDDATVASVMSHAAVTAGQSLEECLDALESTSASAVPVMDTHGENVIGWLTAQRVLAALRDGDPDHRNPRCT